MKYAQSMWASNANQPSRGLERISWEQLDEQYGCSEMVEADLKNKPANFHNLSLKDSQKLYELLDILAEIESAKESPVYKALLAYF